MLCDCVIHDMDLFSCRASTANRSLPDIPKDKSIESGNASESINPDVIYEAAEVLGDLSELYATVQDKGALKIWKNGAFDLNFIKTVSSL